MTPADKIAMQLHGGPESLIGLKLRLADGRVCECIGWTNDYWWNLAEPTMLLSPIGGWYFEEVEEVLWSSQV